MLSGPLVLASLFPDEEIWTSVPQFAGALEVSSKARARSFRKRGRHGGNTLSTCPKTRKYLACTPKKRTGHLMVCLTFDGKVHTQQIGVWMLSAFVGPRPGPKFECCHNDGDASNNDLSNLRWDTLAANRLDSIRHGTHPVARLYDHHDTIRARLAAGARGVDLAAEFGVCQSTISNIKTGVSWSHVS